MDLEGSRIEEDRFTLVADQELWRDWLDTMFGGVLTRYFGRRGGDAELVIRVDGRRGERVDISGPNPWQASAQALDDQLEEGFVPGTVEITLILD